MAFYLPINPISHNLMGQKIEIQKKVHHVIIRTNSEKDYACR